MLLYAARSAGVERVVHVSIANPSIDSPLPYFRGKALVEYALAQSGLPYSIVRPTWVFGGERDVLANNIAWILRRMPAFALPGSGAYPVQPVHVDDLARICIEASRATGDVVIDAAGPETMPFAQLVALVRSAVDARSPIIHAPPSLMAVAARALGVFVGDVVLTPDEIRDLMAGCSSHTTLRWDGSRSATGWTSTGRRWAAPTPTSWPATSTSLRETAQRFFLGHGAL